MTTNIDVKRDDGWKQLSTDANANFVMSHWAQGRGPLEIAIADSRPPESLRGHQADPDGYIYREKVGIYWGRGHVLVVVDELPGSIV